MEARPDPAQEIFNACFNAGVDVLGVEDVYDYVPPEVAYPFIFIGEQTIVDRQSNKDVITGTVSQTIHVWHNDKNEQGTLRSIVNSLSAQLRKIKHTNHFYVRIPSDGFSKITTIDTSTGKQLQHIALYVDFNFN